MNRSMDFHSGFCPATRIAGIVALVAGLVVPAGAATHDYIIDYTLTSGTGTATGTMTIDDAVFLNPGNNQTGLNPGWITALSITISGASGGNGTFQLADFSGVGLNTNGTTLDLNADLTGQGTFAPPMGGTFEVAGAPGTPNSGGPFGLSVNSYADNFVVSAIRYAGCPLTFPFSKDVLKCQDAIDKATSAYEDARYKLLADCRADLMGGKEIFEDKAKTIPVTDTSRCLFEFKSAAALTKAGQKARDTIAKDGAAKCTDALVGGMCSCDTTVSGLIDPTGTGGCLITAVDDLVDELIDKAYGF